MLQAANQLAKLQYSEMQQMRELVATTVQSNLATQMRDEQQRQVSEEIADKVTTFKDEYIVLQELPMF